MKTTHTVILQINGGGSIEEIAVSTKGLADKYTGRGSTLKMIVEKASDPTSNGWLEYLQLDPTLSKTCEEIKNLNNGDIGVYIVSHGSGGSVGGLNVDQLASLIKAIQFPSMRKLSLVACNVSGSMKDDKSQTAINNSFVGKLCELLQPELCPMIASYTGFITVASTLYEATIYKSDKGQIKLTGVDLVALKEAGRKLQKVGRSANKRFGLSPMTPEVRSALKIVLQWRDSVAQVVDLGTWHD